MWKSDNGELNWIAGGYNAQDKEFSIDFGHGEMILEAENVVAWAVFFGDEILQHSSHKVRRTLWERINQE